MRQWRHRIGAAVSVALLALLAGCGRADPATSSYSPRPAAPSTVAAVAPTNGMMPRSMCPTDALKVTATTDRAAYPVGDPVAVSVTVANGSGAACLVPTGSCLPQIVITNAGGVEVWNRAAIQPVCTLAAPQVLAPGAGLRRTIVWDAIRCAGRDPRSCPGGPVPPGEYRVQASWSSTRYGSTGFTVTP